MSRLIEVRQTSLEGLATRSIEVMSTQDFQDLYALLPQTGARFVSLKIAIVKAVVTTRQRFHGSGM